MKSPWIILAILLLTTYSYACTIETITTNNIDGYYSTEEEIIINLTISGDCSNTNLNVYSKDLYTMENKKIYNGPITKQQMQFTTNTNQQTIQKIYATIQPTKTTKATNNQTITTPVITSIQRGRIYTLLTDFYGVYDPYTYEYDDTININLVVYSQSGKIRTSTYGFYFLNNDFNIVEYLTPEFGTCSKLENYPYSCEFPEVTLYPGSAISPKFKITKLTYNDMIFTFGEDGPVLYDVNKPIFSKPFITIKNINTQNNLLNIDYNIYNYDDINYCSLIINGEEKQRDYNINLDNNFVQDVNLGENIIDINCYTDMNHYTYPSPIYDPSYAQPQPQPSADNVLVSLDESLVINVSDFVDGNGLPENPFVVGDCSQLQLINNYSTNHFALRENIDCNGFEFYPINDFNGYFDGNGKTIKNLTINLPEQNNVGLFSILNGTITKIGLQDVNIIGYNNVGGIAGTNNGKIQQTYVTGNITGNKYIGGIAGINERIEVRDGFPYSTSVCGDILKEINDSYSTANIFGNQVLGGITGYNKGKILNVYSTGNINDKNTGGLAGINYTKCYSYTHAIKTGIINQSFSLINPTENNLCYSTWYRGSGATEYGNLSDTINNPDTNYLTNQNNPPFNSWNFETIWKMGNKKTLGANTHPILQWE